MDWVYLYKYKVMEVWRKLISYLSFKKQESPTGEETSFNLKAMHTINKISILMFVGAIILLFVRWVIL